MEFTSIYIYLSIMQVNWLIKAHIYSNSFCLQRCA